MNYTIYIQEKRIASFFQDNMKEFVKRLGRYCKIQIVQMKKPQDVERQKLKAGRNFVVTEEESSVSSEEFASYIRNMEVHGISNCNFFIGCKPVREEYEYLSISRFTISPGLLGAILCEQIYRGYRILNGQPYHK